MIEGERIEAELWNRIFYKLILPAYAAGLLIATLASIGFLIYMGVNWLSIAISLGLFVAVPIFLGSAIFIGFGIKKKMEASNIDENILYFVSYATSLSTAQTSTKDFFEIIAENPNYGVISKVMNRLYHLAIDWALGFSRACKLVSDITPSRLFKGLMARLSHSLEFGEPLDQFFTNESRQIMEEFKLEYEQGLYRLEIIKSIFASLSVVNTFFAGFAMLIPFFVDIPPYILVSFIILVIVLIDLLMFLLISSLLPPDRLELKHEKYKSIRGRNLISYTIIAIMLSAAIFFLLIDKLGIYLTVLFSFSPLVVPGYLAYKYEEEIKELDSYFPRFLQTLITFVNLRGGSIEPVLKSLLTYRLGKLKVFVENLYKRLIVTKDKELSWILFGLETGSNLIFKYSNVFVDSFYIGSDISKVISIVPEHIDNILRLRRKRDESAKNFKNLIMGMFIIISAALFLILFLSAVLTNMLSEAATGKIIGIVGLNIPGILNYPVMSQLLFLGLVAHAFFLTMMIKKAEGGVELAALKDIFMLVLFLVIVVYGIKYFMLGAIYHSDKLLKLFG